MATLNPELRALRDKCKREEQQERVFSAWSTLWQEAVTLTDGLPALLAQRLKPLTSSQLWLVLAVAECEERTRSVDRVYKSLPTKHTDHIAPRTRGNALGYGIPGFTARVGRQLPEFLRLTGNGYVSVTAQGLALLQHLREQFPQLRPEAQGVNVWDSIQLGELGTVPHVRWRAWFGESSRVPDVRG
jgi:hypothetical protein